MEFFIKNKIVIFRVLGAFMLLLGFVVHFWMTPKEGLSESEIAARNVARMEAHVQGAASSKKSVKHKPDTAKFLEKFKSTKAKQMQYLTVFSMVFGVLFLGFSFIKRD